MKKIILTVVCSLVAASVARAEILTAKLTLSSTIASQCTPDTGKGLQPIIWGGVKDGRSVQAIGVLNKKGEETEIVSSEPVEKLLDAGMKAMFEKCGYAVSGDSTENGIRVSVEIKEFFAGAKKGLIIGETEAKGLTTLALMKGGRSVELEFGASVQDKGLKKKNIKKVEKALSDVLTTIVNKVASTNQFADAMRELSK